MRRLLLLPLAAAPALAVSNLAIRPTHAEPTPRNCAGYQIDGGIAFGMAAVAVSSGETPLVGHQVFAVFTDESGHGIGDPVLLVTDDEGGASVSAPPQATGVEFVAEAPAADCSGDVETVSVTRVVPEPSEQVVPAADIGPDEEAEFAITVPDVSRPEAAPGEPLPHTGRAWETAAAIALMCLVVGWWLNDWSRSEVAGQS